MLAASLCVGAYAIDSRREPAPRFQARTLDGQKLTSDDLKGKVVLIQFWATWCKYCRQDQPIVDSLQREFAGQGLVVLAVNAAEPRKRVQQFLQESPRECKVVLAEDTNLLAVFNAKTYPMYVLIDKNGNIADLQEGSGGEDALRELLEKAGLGAK